MRLDAIEEQRKSLRALTRAERLALAGRLMALAIQLRDARYRRRYPDLTPAQRHARCLKDVLGTMAESHP